MKKSNLSKIMLVVAILAIICCISGVNYASNLNEIMGGGETPITDIPTIPGTAGGNSTQQPNNGNNTVPTPIGGNTTGNTTRNITATNTALPKAGANDTLLWVLIGVSAVAALYTYKKVRDYTA